MAEVELKRSLCRLDSPFVVGPLGIKIQPGQAHRCQFLIEFRHNLGVGREPD